MKDKIQLYAEIDMSVTPNETRVTPIEGDPWNDFGYWLEVTSFMAYQAMKVREWDEEQIQTYVRDWLSKSLKDYKVKRELP